MELAKFIEQSGLELDIRINDRRYLLPPYNKKMYNVRIRSTWLVEGRALITFYAEGDTLDEALLKLAERISNKLVKMTIDEKNIKCPTLTHTIPYFEHGTPESNSSKRVA